MTLALYDGISLAITIAGILLAAAAVLLALAVQAKKWEREEQAERAELQGPLSELRAESAEKVTRARFRHTTRHTRRI